jgi:hypothetical protein
MKLTKTLSAFGLMAITATGVLTGPAAAIAGPDASPQAEVVDSDRLVGKFIFNKRAIDQYRYEGVGTARAGGIPQRTLSNSLAGAARSAAEYTFPREGGQGPIRGTGAASGLCLEPEEDFEPYAVVHLQPCDGSIYQDFRWLAVGTGEDRGMGLSPAWVTRGLGTGDDHSVGGNLLLAPETGELTVVESELRADAGVEASVGTPTLQQGGSAQVTASFNAAAGGQRIDIDHPAGTKITAVANSAFSLNSRGISGTLPSGTTSVTFTLTADQNAPIGAALGGQVAYGANRTKLADFTANITSGPVDPEPGKPEVTVETVTVRQGDPVDVPVAFNRAVSGWVEITVPAGLSPVGEAPAGFTWSPADNAFSGTVTDANRTFTMHLKAAPDAPIGFFHGVVSGSGLDKWWFATIEAGAPVADEPVVLTSPAIGAELKPGAPVFSGTGQSGATIQVYSAAQSLLGETEVLSDGTWSLTWNTSLTPGRYSGGTVRQYVGAKPYTSVPYDFTVKSAEVAPLVVTSPKVGATIEETRPVFTGSAQPGAKVEIRGASGSLLGSVDSVASNGAWSITWNKTVVPGRYSGGTVKQFVNGVERGKFVYDFTIGSANVAPLLVTSPKVGETTHETTPVFTGSAQPGAKVEIRGASGAILGSVESVPSNGRWSITWNKTVLPARYSGGTVKQFVNGEERGKFIYDFTIVSSQLVVSSPKIGETISGTRPVFTGTAIPNAEIQIRGAWGTDLGHTAANEHGEWTITWPSDYKPARYSGGTVTESVNGKVIGTFTYDFILTK